MNITLLINKAFNLFKTFLKAIILLWVILFFVIFFKSSQDTKPKSNESCVEMAEKAKKIMIKRQAGVSLTEALAASSNKENDKVIAIIYNNSTVLKTSHAKQLYINQTFDNVLAECIKNK
jgi:uncharacterized membrane protein affecting hemolysin expression